MLCEFLILYIFERDQTMRKTLIYKCFSHFRGNFLSKEKTTTHQTKKMDCDTLEKIILHIEISEICKPKKHNLTNLHQILNKIIGKK